MSKVGPFMVGGAIGALAALLFTPRTGEETRALVTEKVNAVWSEGADLIGVGSGAQDSFKAAQERGAAAFQNVEQAVDHPVLYAQDQVRGSVSRVRVYQDDSFSFRMKSRGQIRRCY